MWLYQQESRSVPIPEPDKNLHNNSKDCILSYPIPSIVALDLCTDMRQVEPWCSCTGHRLYLGQ